MCDTKKQAWDETITPTPNAWSMPDELKPPKKRNTDLRPYLDILKKQSKDVDEREGRTEPPYAARVEKAVKIADAITFEENLEYIRDWKQYEQLELLIQQVDLGKVTIPWLQTFREDLDLKV